MKRLKKFFFTSLFVMASMMALMVVALPQSVAAEDPPLKEGLTDNTVCERPFLTFPTWFRGLVRIETDPTTGANECVILSANDPSLGANNGERLTAFIWRIALNVIEIGLQAVGYIAVGFIIYGGFQYLTGGGETSKIESAKKTLLNAVIGLAIALASVALVNLVFRVVG